MTDTITIVLTILGTGVALAAMILPGQRAMRRETGQLREQIARLETDLREQIARLETDLRERISQLEADLRERISQLEADLRERMGRLEGLFDGFSRSKSDPGSTPDS